jgi:hypothetical protein
MLCSSSEFTQEEQAMLFRNAFGYAGTYTLTRDGVVHHVEGAGDPNPRVLQLIWERIE